LIVSHKQTQAQKWARKETKKMFYAIHSSIAVTQYAYTTDPEILEMYLDYKNSNDFHPYSFYAQKIDQSDLPRYALEELVFTDDTTIQEMKNFIETGYWN
jgi:hypothetical protein